MSKKYAAERQKAPQNTEHIIREGLIDCSNAYGFISSMKCLGETIESAKESSTSEKDLKAQQHMSIWALGVFLVSSLTLVVTSVGIILIWRTMIFTRETLEAARNSNEAAERANEAAFAAVGVTREIGEIQTRAYLSVTRARLMYDEYGCKIDIDVMNVGKSPAYNVKAVFIARSQSTSISGDLDWSSLLPQKVDLANSIGAGIDDTLRFGVDRKRIVTGANDPAPENLVKQVDLIVQYQTEFDKMAGKTDKSTALFLLNMSDLKRGVFSDPEPSGNMVAELTIMNRYTDGGWMSYYQSQDNA